MRRRRLAVGAHPVTPPTSRPSGWSAGTTVTIVSGETDAPVAGARVNVGGTPLTTDAGGQAVVPAAAAQGATVEVEADGFLGRKTLVRYGATRLTLWPDCSRLPSAYTQKLVYTASNVDDETTLVPLERLPPRVRNVSLSPSEAIKADPAAMGAHQQGADDFNAAVQGQVVFSVGGAGDLSVATRIDPEDAACAGQPSRLLARTWVSDYEVTRAEIIFCSASVSRLPCQVAHEIAHVFGLGHSDDRRDVMYPYYYRNDEHGFTAREVLTMSLVQQRRGGNAWPDNDRTATSSARRVRLFVD